MQIDLSKLQTFAKASFMFMAVLMFNHLTNGINVSVDGVLQTLSWYHLLRPFGLLIAITTSINHHKATENKWQPTHQISTSFGDFQEAFFKAGAENNIC